MKLLSRLFLAVLLTQGCSNMKGGKSHTLKTHKNKSHSSKQQKKSLGIPSSKRIRLDKLREEKKSLFYALSSDELVYLASFLPLVEAVRFLGTRKGFSIPRNYRAVMLDVIKNHKLSSSLTMKSHDLKICCAPLLCESTLLHNEELTNEQKLKDLKNALNKLNKIKSSDVPYFLYGLELSKHFKFPVFECFWANDIDSLIRFNHFGLGDKEGHRIFYKWIMERNGPFSTLEKFGRGIIGQSKLTYKGKRLRNRDISSTTGGDESEDENDSLLDGLPLRLETQWTLKSNNNSDELSSSPLAALINICDHHKKLNLKSTVQYLRDIFKDNNTPKPDFNQYGAKILDYFLHGWARGSYKNVTLQKLEVMLQAILTLNNKKRFNPINREVLSGFTRNIAMRILDWDKDNEYLNSNGTNLIDIYDRINHKKISNLLEVVFKYFSIGKITQEELNRAFNDEVDMIEDVHGEFEGDTLELLKDLSTTIRMKAKEMEWIHLY